MPIYKDNAQNRRLKRVGMGYGTECSPCKPKKKKEPKKKEEPKKIPKNLKESIEDGSELEGSGPAGGGFINPKIKCRQIITASKGLIEAEKKGYPKVIDSNKSAFGDSTDQNISLKNPKLKRDRYNLGQDSSVPRSQLEQIVRTFQLFFMDQFTGDRKTPAQVRGIILRDCGATHAQLYDKALEIFKKDYKTIIKKIDSFKSKKRLELEALPINKKGSYLKGLDEIIPKFI